MRRFLLMATLVICPGCAVVAAGLQGMAAGINSEDQGGHTCPVDGYGMTPTGRVQPGYGRMMYEYRCPMGHLAWSN